MRATGVEPASAGVQRPESGAMRRRGLLIGLGLAAACVLAFFAFNRPVSVEGPPPLRPLSRSELRARLSHEQVDPGEMAGLLEPNDAVEAFAEQATQGVDEPAAAALKVVEALRERAAAGAFVPWSLAEPRDTPVMTARETLATLEDTTKDKLYPIEVAALVVSALRSEGVPAMMAELIDVPGERAPLDAAGYLGYFVVAVYPDDAGEGEPKLFDPYGGRELGPDAKFQVLDDVTAIGAALSLRAVHEVAHLGDPRKAIDTSSDALRIAGKLPVVRTGRGIIVLGGKMVEQGLQELDAARQLRPDAVRLHNLASASLLATDVERAESALNAALEKKPDFAGARATLAALHMLRGELDEAKVQLDRAEALAPDLSLVQWAFAEYFMRLGDREAALERGERAIETHASFDAKLRYAVILRQAGRYEPMRKLAHELLESTPSYRKAELRELIAAVLGPTALDPVDDEAAEADALDPAPDLALDSKLLDGQDGAKAELSLDADKGADGPLILGADPSKLRLRGSDDKLKLDLDLDE